MSRPARRKLMQTSRLRRTRPRRRPGPIPRPSMRLWRRPNPSRPPPTIPSGRPEGGSWVSLSRGTACFVEDDEPSEPGRTPFVAQVPMNQPITAHRPDAPTEPGRAGFVRLGAAPCGSEPDPCRGPNPEPRGARRRPSFEKAGSVRRPRGPDLAGGGGVRGRIAKEHPISSRIPAPAFSESAARWQDSNRPTTRGRPLRRSLAHRRHDRGRFVTVKFISIDKNRGLGDTATIALRAGRTNSEGWHLRCTWEG